MGLEVDTAGCHKRPFREKWWGRVPLLNSVEACNIFGCVCGRLAPGGSPETKSWYKRRTCCKSSKVPQIPLVLHLRNIATLLGTCCLRAYL